MTLSKYKIGGSTTIHKWIKKYSNKGLCHSVVKVKAAKEADQESEKVERLKARIARLEKAVSSLTVEKLLLENTIEVYQETYGTELSKKTDANHRAGAPGSEGGVEHGCHLRRCWHQPPGALPEEAEGGASEDP